METTIGLEVHVQLATKTKMFCRCDNNAKNKAPNTTICPICLGMPGVLPVINQQAIEWAILAGLALNCQISELTKFDRKNYFYPDLPKNYQISQYDLPLCKEGYFDIQVDDQVRRIGIIRVHLEEDAGKLIHSDERSAISNQESYSLVDLNRAGTPLLEIVTKPEIKSPKEAKIFLQELQLLMRYLGISEANMEEGHMRCDANISVRPVTSDQRQKKLGIPVEIKNLNSFKAVEKALEYEEKRQQKILESGGVVEKETRGWVDKKGVTISQRTKEYVHDYRYFPEPDLPPIVIYKHESTAKRYEGTVNLIDIEKIKSQLPELPAAKRKRFIEEFNLSSADAIILTSDKNLADFFEKFTSELKAWTTKEKDEKRWLKLIKSGTNWIIRDLLAYFKEAKVEFNQLKLSPENLAELVVMIDEEKISTKIGKEVFTEMLKTGDDPSHIILDKGFEQITDKGTLIEIVDRVITNHPKPVADYQSGKRQAKEFLVGQIMKETKGQANPELVNQLLEERLKGF